MLELRTPVMTIVEVSWEDPRGGLQKIPACMEDRSVSGACIRIKAPVAVGSKLKIQWRFEQFFGTVRYCRRAGREYRVGIQRDTATTTAENPRPSNSDPTQKAVNPAPRSSRAQDITVAIPSFAPQPVSTPNQTPAAAPKAKSAPVLNQINQGQTSQNYTSQDYISHDRPIEDRPSQDKDRSRPTSARSRPVRHGRATRKKRTIPRPHEIDPVPRTKQMQTPTAKSDPERKSMRPRWFESVWRKKPANLHASDDQTRNASRKDRTEKENPMAPLNQFSEETPAQSARATPTFHVELLPMDDVYRIAGIMTPRKGYTINKVMEMLNSEHIRGLSPEMKRSAILMALEAGGIALDQLHRDAEARQQALDSYEAEQSKQLDAEWARKAQEVLEIQAELESNKAHSMARIRSNLEGVAREKAAFAAWLALKQEECQNMTDAVEHCLESPVGESVKTALGASGPVQVRAKAV